MCYPPDSITFEAPQCLSVEGLKAPLYDSFFFTSEQGPQKMGIPSSELGYMVYRVVHRELSSTDMWGKHVDSVDQFSWSRGRSCPGFGPTYPFCFCLNTLFLSPPWQLNRVGHTQPIASIFPGACHIGQWIHPTSGCAPPISLCSIREASLQAMAHWTIPKPGAGSQRASPTVKTTWKSTQRQMA